MKLKLGALTGGFFDNGDAIEHTPTFHGAGSPGLDDDECDKPEPPEPPEVIWEWFGASAASLEMSPWGDYRVFSVGWGEPFGDGYGRELRIEAPAGVALVVNGERVPNPYIWDDFGNESTTPFTISIEPEAGSAADGSASSPGAGSGGGSGIGLGPGGSGGAAMGASAPYWIRDAALREDGADGFRGLIPLGLANTSTGTWAGALGWTVAAIDASSFGPGILSYASGGATGDVRVVVDGSARIRQVAATNGEALADVVVTGAEAFEVRFYSLDQVGAFQDGAFPVSGAPDVTWTFTNPVAIGTYERLRIIREENGTNDVSELREIADGWELYTQNDDPNSGAFGRVERRTITAEPGTGNILEDVLVSALGATTTTVSHVVRTFTNASWGRALVQTVEDPGGANRITRWTYLPHPEDPATPGTIQSVTYPDGRWAMYTNYAIGGTALSVRETWEPWGDLAPDAATAGTCRRTVEVSFGSTVTNRSVYIGGALVERSEFSLFPTPAGECSVRWERAYHTPSACLTNFTETATNRLWTAYVRPDGTRDLHVEEAGNLNGTDFSPNPSGKARRVTIVRGTASSPDGVTYRSTRDMTITDPNGRLIVSEESVYTGSGYAALACETNSYDAAGHRVLATRNGRVTSEATWQGKNLVSEADERGIVTGYSHDAYGRRHQETRAGVTTTYGYDTEGRAVATTRSGGGLSLASSKSYYPTGEIAEETDEMGLTTTYAYSTSGVGGRIETVTLPSGATRVTEYYRDGQLKSVSGTGVVHEFHEYGASAGERWEKVYVGSSDASSPRWRKTWSDMLGRVTREEYPALDGTTVVTVATTNLYDAATGQLAARLEPGLARRLYAYDALGNALRDGLDLNGNVQLDEGGTDRISETDGYYLQDAGKWYRASVNRAWLADGSATATTMAENRELIYTPDTAVLSESVSFDALGQRTTQTTTINRANATETTTTDTPESDLNAVSVTVNGRLASTSTPTVSAPTQHLYDGLGRLWKTIDPRGGETVYGYTGGFLTSVTDPADNTVTMAYHGQNQAGAGQVSTRTHPGGANETFAYDARGNLTAQAGTAAYPVSYGYDDFGQMTSMTTYRAYPGTADTTTWHFEPATGLLRFKEYADGFGTHYTYNALGKVATRTSGRGIVTTYGYDPATGELTTVGYSDGTPGFTNGYDRAGRRDAIADQAGSWTITHAADGQIKDEIVSGGTYGSARVNRSFDSFGRLRVASSQIPNFSVGPIFTYDSRGRLDHIENGTQSSWFEYEPDSDRVAATHSTLYCAQTLDSNRRYDIAGRLTSITNVTSAGEVVSSHVYQYDTRHRRSRAGREDGAYWEYGYNNRSEVTSGQKRFSGGAAMAGHGFEYAFDSIGNRDWIKRGGDGSGGGLVHEEYGNADELNRLTSRANSGLEWITGEAPAGAAVTVNGQAAGRSGAFFWASVGASNQQGPVALPVAVEARQASPATNIVTLVARREGTRLVPPASQEFDHDHDGNMTSDGLWNYEWDAENRLIAMQSASGLPAASRKRVEFFYDSRWRRVAKKVYNPDGSGGWTLASHTRFYWDGWHLIGENFGQGDPHHSYGERIRSYVWGPDISGARGGAGGIGGLLFIIDWANGGAIYSPSYDGNGNVAGLAQLTAWDTNPEEGIEEYQCDQNPVAQYEYGPFGEPLRATGPAADRCPFRFSTKYTDEETGLVYYGYRYYNPVVGRWISRDPAGERFSLNLVAFLDNDGVDFLDATGQLKWASAPNFAGSSTTSVSSLHLQAQLGFRTLDRDVGECGNFRWEVKWRIYGQNRFGWAILQLMNISWVIKNSRGEIIDQVKPRNPLVYTEAFDPFDTDSFWLVNRHADSQGEGEWIGMAVIASTFPSNWNDKIPQSTGAPSLWGDHLPAQYSNMVVRRLSISWCCLGGRREKTKVKGW